MTDLDSFSRLLQAIEPWRAHLVLVGGWAHRLHRCHPLASVPDYDPLITRDTDLAFKADAPLEGDIRSALAAAGFEEELSGDHNPPITHYALGEDDAGFYGLDRHRPASDRSDDGSQRAGAVREYVLTCHGHASRCRADSTRPGARA